MNIKYKWMGLTITVLLVPFILAACSPSSSTEEPQANTPTVIVVEPTQAPSSTPGISLPGTSQPGASPTSEPIILEGAITTDSGLQYLELAAGDGRTPQLGDLVTMNFIGTLPDGTVFADSNPEGKPVTAIIGHEQLLPGWEEGLSLMKAGGKAKLVLPPDLAFGEQGYGSIPPNTQIQLEVDLLSVEKPPQPTSVKEEDLTTTDSGLQYVDLTEGKGPEVKKDSIVTNHFTVWVKGEDTNEFIITSETGDPITFAVGSGNVVFPGWEEGVVGMKVGGKRLLVIPPDLAFGESGASGVPPNSTLIMEVELTDITEPMTMAEVADADYTTTASGLKYYDIIEGKGATPGEGETVVVNYTGWLEDGQQFDSSLNRGSPFSFSLGQGEVIPGWDEGVATMKVGGRRQLVIPSDLAYGDAGSGGVIPPGATLVFVIDLLNIQP